jgi:hypothetical protein
MLKKQYLEHVNIHCCFEDWVLWCYANVTKVLLQFSKLNVFGPFIR